MLRIKTLFISAIDLQSMELHKSNSLSCEFSLDLGHKYSSIHSQLRVDVWEEMGESMFPFWIQQGLVYLENHSVAATAPAPRVLWTFKTFQFKKQKKTPRWSHHLLLVDEVGGLHHQVHQLVSVVTPGVQIFQGILHRHYSWSNRKCLYPIKPVGQNQFKRNIPSLPVVLWSRQSPQVCQF